MSVGAIKAGGAYVELFTKNNRLIAGLNDASRRVKQFGASVQQVGRQIAMFGIGAAVPIALAVRRFMEFDDQMRVVRAVTVGTDEEFAHLTETAKKLGSTTSFTAVQVASLMAELGRAGFTRREIAGVTEAVLNLARASGTEAALAAQILGQTMRQFGLAASDAERIADALTVTANRSVTTVESLGESLQYAGPVAAQFNVTLEDTLAMLGVLGNLGIQGSNAGTALRRLLLLTGTQAQAVGEIFGVNAVDAAGNARPLIDVLNEIGRALAGLGTAQAQQMLFDLYGFLGITGASGLANSVADVRELQEALRNAAGAAAAAAQQMDAGIGGVWRRFMSSIEGVGIAIGEALDMPLRALGDIIRTIVMNIRDWIRENRDLVVAATGWLGVVIALGGALIVLGVAIKIVGFALGALGAVVAIVVGGFKIILGLVLALVSPLGIILSTLTAGALSWAMWTEAGQRATNTIVSEVMHLGRIFQMTFAGIMEALQAGDLARAWEIAVLGMQVVWASGTAAMRHVWREFRDWVIDTFWDAMYAALTRLTMAFQLASNHILTIIRGMNTLMNSYGLGLNMPAIEQAFNFGDALGGQLGQMQQEERDIRRQQREAERRGDMEQARHLQRKLEVLLNRQGPTRKTWRKPPWGTGTTGTPLGGAAPSLGLGNVDVLGTFSGAAASMLGVGGSIQNVRDEGVRTEIRGLRRDVQEVGGVQVV